MDRQEFLNDLSDILGLDGADLQPTVELGRGNWDSVAVVSTIALIDEYSGITLSGEEISNCRTVADVIRLAERGNN